MFWEIFKNKPKEISPRAQHEENRIAEALSALTRTIAYEADANRKQESSEDNWNRWIAIATLVFVMLTTAGIFHQANILNKTDVAIHESAKAAKDAAVAAKDAAVAANIGNRAWISPRLFSIIGPIKDGEKIKVRVVYDNAGKTPALDVEFRSIGKFIAQTDGSIVPLEGYRNARLGENLSCQSKENVVYSGVTFPASNQVGYTTEFEVGDISGETTLAQRIKGRTKILIIQGCYTYKTLDAPHKSSFCSYLDPKDGIAPEQWEFKRCADGNDAD